MKTGTKVTANYQRQLAALNKLSQAVLSNTDLPKIEKLLVRQIETIFGGADCILFSPDGHGYLVPKALSKPHKGDLKRMRLRFGEGMSGRVWNTKRPLYHNDIARLKALRRRIHPTTLKLGIAKLLSIPLLMEGEPVAVLSVGRTAEQPDFTDLEAELLTSFGNQAAIAIRNASFYRVLRGEQEALEKRNKDLSKKERELRQSNIELKVLNDISNIVNSSLDLDRVLKNVLHETLKALGFKGAAIYLYNHKRKRLEVICTYSVNEPDIRKMRPQLVKKLEQAPLGLTESLAGLAFRSGRVICYDQSSPKHRNRVHQIVEQFGIKALTHIPVIAAGNTIGTIAVASNQEVRLGLSQLRLASAIGQQVGMAIENARVHEALKKEQQALHRRTEELLKKEKELRRSNKELILLNEISNIASGTLNPDKVLRSIMRETCRVLGFQAANIYFYNPKGRVLELRSSYNVPERFLKMIQDSPLQVDRSLAGQAFKSGKVVSHQKLTAQQKRQVHKLFHLLRVRDFVHIPVTAQSGRIGVMTLASGKEVRLDPSQQRLASAIGQQAGMAIENARLYGAAKRRTEQLAASNQRLQTLLRISAAAVESTRLDSFLGNVTKLVAKSLKADRCSVVIVDETKTFGVVRALYPKGRGSFPRQGTKLRLADLPHLARTCLHGEIGSFSLPRFTEASEQERKHILKTKMKSGMVVALSLENEALGAMAIWHAEADRGYTQQEVEFLLAIGNQVATAIKKFELAQELEEKRKNLERLSSEMIRLEEKQRQAVAGELHDGIGQALTAMRLNLDFTEALVPPQQEQLRSRIRQISELAGDTIREIRDIEQNLRPRVLDDLGLVPALRWLARSFSQQVCIPVSFRPRGNIKGLTPDLQITIYRIVQEGLNNIAKHAQAGEAWVDLQVKHDLCLLQIKDNGIGFDPEKVLKSAHARKSFGVFNIRERTALLGGKLEIVSDEGKGTTLRVTIPIREGGTL